MAQAVSCRPPTAEDRVRSRLSPCGVCGGQSGNGTGFSPSTSVFPCQFHSNGAPLLGKRQKIIIIAIYITGLHKKRQGCGASVASAAGPFTTKKNAILHHSDDGICLACLDSAHRAAFKLKLMIRPTPSCKSVNEIPISSVQINIILHTWPK
jgi:hypothetical protein